MSSCESIFNYYAQRQDWQNLLNKLGLNEEDISNNRQLLREYINLKLMTLGIDPISSIDSIVSTPAAPR